MTGSITLGTAKSVTISTPGQRALYTFAGTLNQKITTNITANTFPNCGDVYLLAPDQTTTIYTTCTQNAFTDPVTLTQAGTWTLVIDPYSSDTGSLSITLTSVPDITGTITLGTAKVVTISNPGQQAVYTFSGTAGQQIASTITGNTFANCGNVYLQGPAPNSTEIGFACTQDGFTDPAVLTDTGTWTLVIDPSGSDTGSLSITLSNIVDVTGSITLGTAKSVTISTPGQRALYTFAGTLNQKITTNITANTFPNCGDVYLLAPDQTTTIYTTCTQNAFTDPVTLTQAGTWTLVIDPYSSDTGSLSIKLTSVPDITGTITLGTAKVVTISNPGQQAVYTFTGAVNQRIAMTVSANSFTNCGSIYLVAPDTSVPTSACTANGFTDPITLTEAGTWSVVVDPSYTDTGSLTLTLTSVTDVTGTITIGTAKAVTITQAGQRALYTFNRNSGQGMKASIASSTIASGTVYFYDPSGNYFAGCGFGPGASVCGPYTASASGTWTVIIDPDSTNTGSLNLTITAS